MRLSGKVENFLNTFFSFFIPHFFLYLFLNAFNKILISSSLKLFHSNQGGKMKIPRNERIWNDFIEGLDGAILTALSEKLDNEQLRARIIELVQETCGGLLVYIPKGLAGKVSARNSIIRREFTGDNHHELSRKYGVSVQWIYEILGDKNESN